MATVTGSAECFSLFPPCTLEQPSWYAIHTRSRHEWLVKEQLRSRGVETFLPETTQVHRWSDRRKLIRVPLFACYLFIRAVLSPQVRQAVLFSRGVATLVGNGHGALPIPDEQIESVHRILERKTPCIDYPFLKIGQRVRIRGGALDGVEGVFLSQNGDRTLVLSVDAIQRSLAIRLQGYDIEVL